MTSHHINPNEAHRDATHYLPAILHQCSILEYPRISSSNKQTSQRKRHDACQSYMDTSQILV